MATIELEHSVEKRAASLAATTSSATAVVATTSLLAFTSSPLFKPLVAGALTGAIESFITYPTEFVKTHMQLQLKGKPMTVLDCTFTTLSKHGPLGLYRGLGPILAGSIPKQAFRWATYEMLTAKAKSLTGKSKLSLAEVSLCGFGAGAAEAFFAVIPTETIKTRLIADQCSMTPKYAHCSLPAAVFDMIRHGGVRSIYRGVCSTVMKQSLNQSLRFPAQLTAIQALSCTEQTKWRRKSPIWNGIAGAMAGVFSVILTQPFDVVKTRMQQGCAGLTVAHTSTYQCWASIARNEGLHAFYSGCVPRMVRVGADVALAFTLFPLIKQALC